MKRKNYLYLLPFVGALALGSCASDQDIEDFEDEEQAPSTPDKENTTARNQWKFGIKIMIDRKTYDTYYKTPQKVNEELAYIFKRVAELHHGKKDSVYFDADMVFEPHFDESCVYDGSSMQLWKDYTNGTDKSLRGNYPYLAIVDGCVGDFEGEEARTDYTLWGSEVVRMFDNGTSASGTNDGGATTYPVLSRYRAAIGFAHELGHGRGVPDIYEMRVTTNNVNGESYEPVTCMMNDCWGTTVWSEYSQRLINRNKGLKPSDPGFIPLDKLTLPKTLKLEVKSSEGNMAGAKVNVYKSVVYSNTIENKVYHTGTLDNSESVSFPVKDLFYPDNSGLNYSGIKYGTVLFEVVQGDKKYYKFIDETMVQMAYFNGQTDACLFNVKFPEQ